MERITDLNDPRVKLYTALNEKQLKRYYEPEPGLFICESERVIRRAQAAGYEIESVFAETGKADLILQADVAANAELPIFVAEKNVMEQITGYTLTGGILAAMKRKLSVELDAFLASCEKVAVLEDIENPTNVGAIFRSAAALGADGILLTEGCADPLYRRAARVSMGTVFQVKWCFGPMDYVRTLKAFGFDTIALALSEDAVDLGSIAVAGGKRAVILGNEDHGICDNTLRQCSHIVKIPMTKGVDSLNVSAASAVAFWEIFRD